MRRLRFTLLAALLPLFLLAGPAHGFDPHQVDILTLRLGMTEAEATDRPLARGIPIDAIAGQRRPCPDTSQGTCLASVTAPTRDGRIVQHFRPGGRGTAPPSVDSIVYTLKLRSVGEPAMIRASVLGRYGPPNVLDPPTWCARVERSGACPIGQARLTFQSGAVPYNAGTLTLAEP